MIIQFKFKYSHLFTPEQQATITKHWPDSKFDEEGKLLTWWTELVATIDLALSLGLELEDVKRWQPPVAGWTQEPREFPRASTGHAPINKLTQVMVPGNALLEIEELKVMEDPCTDEVHGQLQLGWRILAICPQPDQRRPDWILGRRSTEK